MTDLHTHILPGMDDGAHTTEQSLAMLRAEAAQGVRQVALTPHFYRHRETEDAFLRRREEAWDRLQTAISALSEEEQAALPRLSLGAEVAWQPNTGRWEALEQLRIGENGPVLLELPFTPWSADMLRQLYDLRCRTRCTILLAHLNRYFKGQKKEHIREIVSMGMAVQLDADRMERFMDRRALLRLLGQEGPFLLASDCHNLSDRKPCLGPAAAQLEKSLGAERSAVILVRSDALFSLLPAPKIATP